MIISAGTTHRNDDYEYTRLKHTIGHRFSAGYLHRGESYRTVHGQTIVRRAPSFCLTKPGAVFHTRAKAIRSHYLSFWVVFSPRPEWQQLLQWPDSLPGSTIIDLPKGPIVQAVHHAFSHLVDVHKGVHPNKKALMDNLLEHILLQVHGLHSLHGAHKGRLLDERLGQAVDFMNAHLKDKIKLADIAAAIHLSPSRFAHLFSETFGVSPMRYLELQRIEAAKALLLRTNDPIYMISEKVGFDNAFHFSTRFHRCVGQSPRAFGRGTLEHGI